MPGEEEETGNYRGDGDNESINIHRPKILKRPGSSFSLQSSASSSYSIGGGILPNMNVDMIGETNSQEVHDWLEKTNKIKHQAFMLEDDNRAKNLQQTETELKKALRNMQTAEVEKKKAVAEGDFDRAVDLSLNLKSYKSAASLKYDLSRDDLRLLSGLRPTGLFPLSTEAVRMELEEDILNNQLGSPPCLKTSGFHLLPTVSFKNAKRNDLDEEDILWRQKSSAIELSELEGIDPKINKWKNPHFPLASAALKSENKHVRRSKLSSFPVSLLPHTNPHTNLSTKKSFMPSSRRRDEELEQSSTRPVYLTANSYAAAPSLISTTNDGSLIGVDRVNESRGNTWTSANGSILSPSTNPRASPDNFTCSLERQQLVSNAFDEQQQFPLSPTAVNYSHGEDWLLSQINPSDRRYARRAIGLFGIETVGNIYSIDWKRRFAALKYIQEKMEGLKEQPEARNVLKMAIPAITHGLNDKLFGVYSAAIDLLNFVLSDFLPKHNLVESDAKELVNSTYQTLINRTGDTITDKRFAVATYNLFGEIFKGNIHLANLYMHKVLLPFDKTESVRVDQGKARIVWTGVNLLWGKSISSMSIKKIYAFALECINHPDLEMRNIGKNLVVFMYERGNRGAIKQMLAHSSRVPQSLFDELGRIDRTNNTEDNLTDLNNDKGKNVRLLVDSSKRDLESVDYSQICMYCGHFVGEHLVKHCSENCPMLTNCPNCLKVVETRYLRDHVLYDCIQKFHYKICDRCHQPIEGCTYEKHRKGNNCKVPQEGSITSRCLLCGLDVNTNNDIGWIKHLTNDCSMNTRRT